MGICTELPWPTDAETIAANVKAGQADHLKPDEKAAPTVKKFLTQMLESIAGPGYLHTGAVATRHIVFLRPRAQQPAVAPQ